MTKTILIVDDSAINRATLRNILEREYSVAEVENGAEAMNVLRRMDQSFTAVMLDIVMPVMDGYQVLEQIRQSPILSHIPVIVTTASADGDAEIKALRLGASDYIPKPYNPEIILHRIDNIIKLRESGLLINAIKHDRLTGLLSREPFFFEVEKLLSGKPAGYYILSAFDIDRFSLINDQYGRAKGDELLKRVAEALDETISPLGGLCGRITADNFAALYPAELKSSGALEALRSRTARVDDTIPQITFSVGRYTVDDLSQPAATMYDHAYLAKTTVKGRYDVHIAEYDEAMLQNALRVQRIVDEMKTSLDNGQFEAWYQPQYNSYTGALVGAEALARWRHPTHGLVQPDVFIPVFERNGFVYELDKCIWEQACAFLRGCLDSGGNVLPVSVNISRNDVLREDLTDVLAALVRKYSLPVELLRLEITESAFAGDSGRIIDVVNRLVGMGFVVEIDDFGSGYSSLNTLKDVPAQIIKLDLGFLEGSNNLERGGSIIESIVRMAKWLGMSVIAEGVENAEHVDFLKSIGCSYSQGYFYDRPMPGSAYAEKLARAETEEHLSSMQTVADLDSNTFWNPKSMDTLIFNSYVGAACIFEYNEGRIELLRVSAKYVRLFSNARIDIESALGLDWAAHMDDEDARTVRQALEQSARSREDVPCELVFRDLPQCPPRVYLRFRLRVIATAGARQLVYATYENATAQREAELKARRSAERLAAILSSIDAGVVATSIDEKGVMRTVFANEAYYSMLGYTGEQYDSEVADPMQIVLLEDRQRVTEAIGRVMTTGCGGETGYRCVKRDGSVCSVSCHGSLVSTGGSDERVVLRVMKDVTRQTADAKRLSDAEQVQAILHAFDGGISAITITDGRVECLFANDRYYEMFGYTREQFAEELPNGIRSLVLPRDERKVYAAAMVSEKDGASSDMLFRARRRDGKVIRVHVRSSVSRFTGIEQPVHVAMMNDVSRGRKRCAH